jgi:hypothetical protein
MTSPTLEGAQSIKDPTALPGGYGIVISVEAIRDRTERNWSIKQDTVWDFAQRQFEKTFPRTDAIRKLDDVQYLVAQVAEEGTAAQFKAIDLLKTILIFFLGSSTLSQLRLSIVRSIADGVIEAEPMSQDEIRAVAEGMRQCAAPLFAPQIRTHPPNQVRLALKADRSYEVVLSIDPIWNVYKQAVASYYPRLLVYESIEPGEEAGSLDDISLRDVLAIDLAILKNAASLIRDGQQHGSIFALHVPISFRCLRSVSCRSELGRLLPLFEDIRKLLAFCIVGVPDGAPKSILAETISVLRPYGMGVVMQSESLNEEVQRWRDLGLSAVAYDFIDEMQDGPDIIKRTKDFGAACSGVARTLIGLNISTRPLLMAAWGAGFTHISGTPITEKMPERRAAIRFPAAQIYS